MADRGGGQGRMTALLCRRCLCSFQPVRCGQMGINGALEALWTHIEAAHHTVVMRRGETPIDAARRYIMLYQDRACCRRAYSTGKLPVIGGE